jgi:hypothetical protein
MRFARSKNESIACTDRRRTGFVADEALAGDDVVVLPLRAVDMIRIGRFPGRNAKNLDVEGMALHQVHRLRLAAQCDRDLLAEAGETSFR